MYSVKLVATPENFPDEILRLTGYGEEEIVSLKKRGIVNSKTVIDMELK